MNVGRYFGLWSWADTQETMKTWCVIKARFEHSQWLFFTYNTYIGWSQSLHCTLYSMHDLPMAATKFSNIPSTELSLYSNKLRIVLNFIIKKCSNLALTSSLRKLYPRILQIKYSILKWKSNLMSKSKLKFCKIWFRCIWYSCIPF